MFLAWQFLTNLNSYRNLYNFIICQYLQFSAHAVFLFFSCVYAFIYNIDYAWTPISSLFFQVEAGFFHESDAKIVAKSIRDRVALILWRRERIWPILQSEDRRDSDCSEKQKATQAQQVQVTYLSHTGHHILSEPEEPEADQHLSQQNLPTSVTSLACKSSTCVASCQYF